MPHNKPMPLATVDAIRYVLPLREGGSLPAIVDTDGGGQFAVKFRGAGQGPKALVAEVIAWGIARAIGLPVPDAAIVRLGDGFGAGEPDPEIQDLLRASTGLNFGLRYLSGALGFDAIADAARIDDDLAGEIVWFDALITNVDRTVRNPNILVWNEKPWLIDHGAALYFHHAASDWPSRAHDRFPLIKDHILIAGATHLREVDARLGPRLTRDVLGEIVANIPDDWLTIRRGARAENEGSGPTPDEVRLQYIDYLEARLGGGRPWLDEAINARDALLREARP
jgi:hypothetical protein